MVWYEDTREVTIRYAKVDVGFSLKTILTLLPELLTEFEKLERESAAGKALAEVVRQMILKARPHNEHCQMSCCRAWDKECQDAFLDYRSTCEDKNV